MRIAFVAPFGLRAKGTTCARALPLAQALASRGHAIALVIPPYDSPEDSGKRWEQSGVDIINMRLPRFRTGFGTLEQLKLAWRVLISVRRWEPDVVHVFKPKGPSGLVGAAIWLTRSRTNTARQGASVQPRPPSLVMDCDDWEGPGGWNDDPRVDYSAIERRFFTWQECFGLSHADAWTVTSTCLRDRAVRLGADPSRVFVLPNGVPATLTSLSIIPGSGRGEAIHRTSATSQQLSTILYTRFAGVRVQDVAAIWSRVREVSPEARLTVIGHGLAGEEEALRDVPGIEVLGWIEPGELPARFAAAHMAVVPWADTPSNRARHSAKVLELMAAGLAIVAYAVGELPATLGDAGVLVEPGDEAAFARAIVEVLGDRELAQRLGALARRRVFARYRWERLAEIAIEAYWAAGTHPNEMSDFRETSGELDATRKTTSE